MTTVELDHRPGTARRALPLSQPRISRPTLPVAVGLTGVAVAVLALMGQSLWVAGFAGLAAFLASQLRSGQRQGSATWLTAVLLGVATTLVCALAEFLDYFSPSWLLWTPLVVALALLGAAQVAVGPQQRPARHRLAVSVALAVVALAPVISLHPSLRLTQLLAGLAIMATAATENVLRRR